MSFVTEFILSPIQDCVTIPGVTKRHLAGGFMNISKRVWCASLAFAAVLSAPTFGSATIVSRVIFSNIQTSPTSDIPGTDLKFRTGTGTQFDRPYLSPDGSRWIFTAFCNSGNTTNDEVIVVGGGLNGSMASVMLREGSPAFFDASGNYATIDQTMDINDAGQIVFSCDTTLGTASDEFTGRWNGLSFELIAREGTQAVGQPAGVGYGTVCNASNIDSSGRAWIRSASLVNASTQQALFTLTDIADGSVYSQTDTTAPAGQLVAPDQTIDNLTSERFRIDADGSNAIYHADLNGPTATDVVMVFNGAVLAQEGAILPNSGFTSTVLTTSADAGSQDVSEQNGKYIFRGGNADGTDWVVSSDNNVIAVTDGPIHAGATEQFDDAPFAATFFVCKINSYGDTIVGGTTNNADANANAVLVFNGWYEVIREGAPVDVDGNGIADDNAFVSVFNNDDCVLTDSNFYYYFADLRDGIGTSLGQAFMVAKLPLPGDADDDDEVNLVDFGLMASAFGTAVGDPGYNPSYDFDKNGEIDLFDHAILSANFGRSR